MNEQRFDEIKARLGAIKNGWLWDKTGKYQLLGSIGMDVYCHDEYDLPFIIHAPDDIRALLDQHDADTARIEALETALRALRDLPPVGVIPDNVHYRRGYNVARDRVSVIAKKALGDNNG